MDKRAAAIAHMNLGAVAIFAVLSLLLNMAGCAPGLGNTLEVQLAEQAEIRPLKESVAGSSPRIQVLKFTDARPVEAIAQIDGRVIKPRGDLGTAVSTALEHYLGKNGVRLSMFDAAIMRGEIKEWKVFVTPGFPSTTMEATAALVIELLDKNQKLIHKARYSGSFNQQHPVIGEHEVSAALGKALDFALREALSDPQLINKISTLPPMG